MVVETVTKDSTFSQSEKGLRSKPAENSLHVSQKKRLCDKITNIMDLKRQPEIYRAMVTDLKVIDTELLNV